MSCIMFILFTFMRATGKGGEGVFMISLMGFLQKLYILAR